jgi:hypothetical protein
MPAYKSVTTPNMAAARAQYNLMALRCWRRLILTTGVD